MNEVARRYNVYIVLVLGHTDNRGNCRADELTRPNTTIEFYDESLSIVIPLIICKVRIDDDITDSSNSRYAA